MKAVFEKIAEELLAIERTNDRLDEFEAQYAARTLGGRFYNAEDRANRATRYARKQRLAAVLLKAARKEQERIISSEGKKPWPPCLRWPFSVVA